MYRYKDARETLTLKGNDLCLAYYCSVDLGGVCTNKPAVNCTPPNDCYTSACNSSTGQCYVTPKPCPDSTTCYNYVCQNSTGQCVKILRANPAQDDCHISGCFNDTLVDNQAVNCNGTKLFFFGCNFF